MRTAEVCFEASVSKGLKLLYSNGGGAQPQMPRAKAQPPKLQAAAGESGVLFLKEFSLRLLQKSTKRWLFFSFAKKKKEHPGSEQRIQYNFFFIGPHCSCCPCVRTCHR